MRPSMRQNEERIKKVYDLMRENHLHGDVWEDFGLLCIEVNWGDWKHDHLRLDWVMKENFNILMSATETTEENGSDCYSAIHYYVLGGTSTPTEDMRDTCGPVQVLEVM